MSVEPFVSVMNLEEELVKHLLIKDSLEKVVKDGLSDHILILPKVKSAVAFAKHYYNESTTAPTAEVFNTEFPDHAFDLVDPESSIDWVIEKLRNRYRKSEIWDLTLKLADHWKADQVDEAIGLLRNTTVEIEKNTLSHTNTWSTGDHKMFIGMIQDEIIHNKYKGYSVGFSQIDKYTGGLKPGYLAFLAARPKRMKSFFLIQSFIEQIKQGHTPVFFTLELTHKEIMSRFMCMVSGYPWDKAQRGEFSSSKDWDMIEKTWLNFTEEYGKAFVIQPKADERSVSQLMLLAEKNDCDSIFISQLKYITPVKNYYNSHEQYAEIVIDLKNQAVKTGSERPIYVEAQFNREAQSVKELQDLDLAQLGLTDAIGQTADVVYSIVQSQDMYNSGVAEMGIVEARNHGKTSWMFQSEFKKNTYLKCLGLKELYGA